MASLFLMHFFINLHRLYNCKYQIFCHICKKFEIILYLIYEFISLKTQLYKLQFFSPLIYIVFFNNS